LLEAKVKRTFLLHLLIYMTEADKERVKKYLPEGFESQYQEIRGMFDGTEIKCDIPKDYQSHSEMYSDYKSR